MPAPHPLDEAERLERLRALLVLDSPPEPLFDQITRMASQVCGTPVALLSLVDEERQWFKAQVGLAGISETPRDQAFCAHAIGSTALMQVEDAQADPRFADNPLVTAGPGIRFYAGMPLPGAGVERVGTLCVIDHRPRQLDAAQQAALADLALLAAQALQMRRDLVSRALTLRSTHEAAVQASEARYRALVEQQRELVSLCRPDGSLLFVNAAYARHHASTAASLVGCSVLAMVAAEDRSRFSARLAQVAAGRVLPAAAARSVAADGAIRWVEWTHVLQRDGAAGPSVHSVGRDVTAQQLTAQQLAASEAFLERTNAVAGIGGWSFDPRSRTVTWTAQTRRIHETAADFEPTLSQALDFFLPEGRERLASAVQRLLGEGSGFDLELPLRTAQQRDIWVRVVAALQHERGYGAEGGAGHAEGGAEGATLVGALQDITAMHAARVRLQSLSDEQAIMLENDLLGITKLRQRRVVWMNRTAGEQFGYQPGELIGHSSRLIFGDDESHAALDMAASAALAAEGRFRTELRLRHKSGRVVWVDTSGVRVKAADGGVDTIWVSADITAIKEHQLRVEHMAFHDALTGLPNRRLLMDRLSQALALAERQQLRVAVCFIDLDGFKAVNDSHGHDAGDALLVEMAQRLQADVRVSDTVARLGGDEFVVLLTPLEGSDDWRPAVERLVATAQRALDLPGGSRVQVSASIGVALSGVHGHDAAALLGAADTALYSAKRSGRNRALLASAQPP